MAQIPKPPNDKRLKEMKNRYTKEAVILQLFNLEKQLNEQIDWTRRHGSKAGALEQQIKVTADQHKENMKNKDAKIDELKKMVENSNETFDATSKEIENLCTQNNENKEAWKKARKDANEKADENAVLNGLVAGQDDQISNLNELVSDYEKQLVEVSNCMAEQESKIEADTSNLANQQGQIEALERQLDKAPRQSNESLSGLLDVIVAKVNACAK